MADPDDLAGSISGVTVLPPGSEPPPPSVDLPEEADQAAEAAAARAAASATPRRRAAPQPGYQPKVSSAAPATDAAGEDNPYAKYVNGPKDNGPALLERARLNFLNNHYRETAFGAGRLAAMAHIYSTPDSPDDSPETKQVKKQIRAEYEDILLDLVAYDEMPGFDGLPSFGAAFLGALGGSLTSPEAFLGWASSGATWLARTGKAAVQQGLISGAIDPVVQLLAQAGGAEARHGVDWGRVGLSTLTGAGIGGGMHAGGELAAYGSRQIGGWLQGQQAIRQQFRELAREDAEFAGRQIIYEGSFGEGGRAPEPLILRDVESVAPDAPTPDGARPIADEVPVAPPTPREPTPDELYGKPPEYSYEDAVATAKENAAAADREANKAAKEAGEIVTRKQPGERDFDARQKVLEDEVGDQLKQMKSEGFESRDIEDIAKLYDRQAGEHPQVAFERAHQQWADEALAEARRVMDDIDDNRWFYDELDQYEAHFYAESRKARPAADTFGQGRGGYGGEAFGDARPGVEGRLPEGAPHLDPIVKQEPPFEHQIEPQSTGGGSAGPSGREVPRQGGAAEGSRAPAPTRGEPRGSSAAASEGAGGERVTAAREYWEAHDLETKSRHAGDDVGYQLEKRTPEWKAEDDRRWELLKAAERGETLSTERTIQGEQTLIPGVAPVTDRQRIEAQMGKPLTGGDRAMPEGGLFDMDGRAQQDIFARAEVAKTPDIQPFIPSRQGSRIAGEIRREDVANLPAPPPGTFSPSQDVALKSMQQSAIDLANKIGFPFRQGRVQMRGAWGIYKTQSGVVRVKEIADFEIVSHEAAHALEQRDPNLTPLTQQYAAELRALDYDQDPQTGQRVNEGFAEWFRTRLNNVNYAKSSAPGFFNAFDAYMQREQPDLYKFINDMAASREAFRQAPSPDVIAAVVRHAGEEPTMWGRAAAAVKEGRMASSSFTVMNQASKDFYTSYVDRFAPVEQVVRELVRMISENTGGQLLNLKAAYNPAVLIRSLHRAAQSAHVETMKGVIPHRSDTPVGPGLNDGITEAIGAPSMWGRWNQAKVNLFDNYLTARRAVELWDRFDRGLIPNDPVPFNRADAIGAVREFEAAFPTFRRAGDMIHEYGRNLLKKRFDAGLMTPDQYTKALEHDFYVPMRRDVSDKPMVGSGGASAEGRYQAGAIHQLKGSMRDILSPLESFQEATFHTEQDIRWNEIKKGLANLGDMAGPGAGLFVERVPAHEVKAQMIDLERAITDAAKRAGLPERDRDAMIAQLKGTNVDEPLTVSYFAMEMAKAHGEPIMFYWEGGRPVAIRVMSKKDRPDAYPLYETMMAAPQQIVDLWVNTIGLGGEILRGGVVMHPAYIANNYIRDQMQVALTRPGYIPFLGGLPGLWNEVRQDQTALMRAYFGGEVSGSMVGEINRQFERGVQQMAKQNYLTQRMSWRGAMEFFQITEAATRNSVFGKTYKEGLNNGLTGYEAAWQAAHDSDDILPFSRRGSKMLVLANIIPFLNTNIVGQDKVTFRTMIEPMFTRVLTEQDRVNRNRAIWGWTAGMAAPIAFGMAWAAINWDDENYRDANPAVKGTHWMTKLRDKYLLIPKPFELGAGFNAGEYGYAAWVKEDPRAAKQWAESLWENFMLPAPWKLPLITPSVELATNTSFFGWRPIVPDQVQKRVSEEQYTERTSEFAKMVGRELGWSPMKVDYALGAYFGTWGRDAMLASNALSEDTPAAGLDDTMFLRRNIKDQSKVSGNAKLFWEYMSHKNGKYIQLSNSYKFMVEEAAVRGQPATRAKEFLDKMKDAERAYVVMQQAGTPDGRPAFQAQERRLHPFERAQKASTVLSGVARDLADNTLVPYRATVRMPLDPEMRRDLIDRVRTLAGLEMRNAFVITKEPGYADRAVIDPNEQMDLIRKMSPEVADEISKRYAIEKIYRTDAVAQMWPRVKDDINRFGSNANLKVLAFQAQGMGFEFGAARAKRLPPVRQPIGAKP